MSWRSRFGLDFAPVFLRLALGAVFVYAGAGKLFYSMPLAGAGASRLVALGLAEPPDPSANFFPNGVPPRDAASAPFVPPAVTPPAGDAATPDVDADGPPQGPAVLPPPEKLGRRDADKPAKKPAVTVVLPEDTTPEIAFDGEISVPRRLGLVLAMDGALARGQWPGALATSEALDGLAWAAALTEFIGGWLVLLGLMTRIWAVGLAGTMVAAMWLTQIGPAMHGSDPAFLGFLPPLQISDPAVWTTAWQTLFHQFTLMCAAAALALIGAGALSLDGMLFGGSRRRPPAARAPRSSTGAKRPDTMSR